MRKVLPNQPSPGVQAQILAALQPRAAGFGGPRPKHVYAGTVPDAVIERRRAKNKRARAARRVARGRS